MASSVEGCRRLIVTADDYGISSFVDAGIRAGVEAGIVNTVSAMTNLPGCMASLAALHSDHPEIGIGVHLNVTSGRPLCSAAEVASLVDGAGAFLCVAPRVSRIAAIDPGELYLELKTQILTLLEAGIRVDHLSSQHNLLMLYSPFIQTLIRLAREFDVPARSPVPLSFADKRYSHCPIRKRGAQIVGGAMLKAPVRTAAILRYARLGEMIRNRDRLAAAGVRHPDLTVDVLWGSPTPETLHRALACAPSGVSELIVHLGRGDKSGGQAEPLPSGVDEEYFAMREVELALVTTPLVRKRIDALGYTFCGYEDLGEGRDNAI